MRGLIVLALALPLCGCGVIDHILAERPSLPSNKIYLGRADFISVSARDTHRYACIDRPLLCVQRGIDFECRCP